MKNKLLPDEYAYAKQKMRIGNDKVVSNDRSTNERDTVGKRVMQSVSEMCRADNSMTGLWDILYQGP